MFPDTYFPSSYFTSSYWGESGKFVYTTYDASGLRERLEPERDPRSPRPFQVVRK